MSESMAGVTFLAFGNGSPDVFSTFAAMSSHSGSLAIGELIGAAGFITAVVAGSMALVREFKVGKKTFVRDIGFFIVAVSFSMSFLADGSLHLWECCVMIAFYIFYVITVVVWHWYLQQRRRRRERFAAARGHYYAPDNVEIEVQEEYQDDEDAPTGEGRSILSRRSTEDWAALERGSSPGPEGDSDNDEEGRQSRRLAAEMSNSMRVIRPRGSRRNTTVTPIRPSLVGAMEFRSVLASLQKSRSVHGRPIHLRRYSDDPLTSAQNSRAPPSLSITSEADETAFDSGQDDGGKLSRLTSITSRARAASVNDAAGLKPLDPAAFSVATIPDIGVVAATPTFPRHHLDIPHLETHVSASGPPSLAGALEPSFPASAPPSPTFSISPPPSIAETRSRESSAAPQRTQIYEDRLAPPDNSYSSRQHRRQDSRESYRSVISDGDVSPRTTSPSRPRLQIPLDDRNKSISNSSSPILAFPAYTDSPLPLSAHNSRPPSLHLPAPDLSPQVSYSGVESDEDDLPRPLSWWPYQWLPDPWVILATLFPTLTMWRNKSIVDKFLSVASAPSIFLLAVTLPVVETEAREEDLDVVLVESHPHRQASSGTAYSAALLPAGNSSLGHQEEGEWTRYRRATMSHSRGSSISGSQSPTVMGTGGYDGTASVAVSAEHHHQHSYHSSEPSSFPFLQEYPNSNKTAMNSHAQATPQPIEQKESWNRWLVIVQIFTAPLFVMFIIWANSAPPTASPESSNWGFLLKLVLYSLLGSLIALALLLLVTSPDKAPKHRFILCFVGFIVAISWISTIANEVVGVLKAFGVILGISDAILGLTIFAVGNSLGDLIADITVARLGYPVMALSACFGGPMLNILIGIGVSGLYMTIKEADHKHHKHPDKKVKYRPYEIEVSGTLMISAITLLVTLVGLLIVVPMNKWVMSRRIGYGLIALWAVGTVVNLAVEVSGVWGPTTSIV